MSETVAPIGEDDLQTFIDARLDASRRAEVEAYLADHPDVARRVETERRQRDLLREALRPLGDAPVPARLRVAALAAARRERFRRNLRAVAAACTIFVAGSGGGWFAGQRAAEHAAPPHAAPMAVAAEAGLAYRTFVVEVMHPVEVRAAEQAHLMAWLSKRLGRPLAAPDLSAYGFRLMGGRLLPGGSGAAAQLMYDDDAGTRLTVYVEASQGNETAFRFARSGDAATFAWIDRGFGFAVTARADRSALLPIAEAVYKQLDGGRAAASSQGG